MDFSQRVIWVNDGFYCFQEVLAIDDTKLIGLKD